MAKNDRSVVGNIVLALCITLCVIMVLFTVAAIIYAIKYPGSNVQWIVDIIVSGWSTLFGVIIGFIAGRSGQAEADRLAEETKHDRDDLPT